MADQATIIEGEGKPEEQPTPVKTDPVPETKDNVTAPLAPDYTKSLGAIVTADGRQKYNSVDDALNSIVPAQSHIVNLEHEAQNKDDQILELTNQLEKAKGAEELAEIIRSKPGEPSIPAPDSGLKREEVADLVISAMKTEEIRKARATNIDKAVTTLVAHFGSTDDTEKAYRKLAEDKGLSVNILNEIAAQSPDELIRMFGVDVASKPAEKIAPTFNPSVITAQQDGTKTETPSVMGGANTEQLVKAWRAAAPTE